MTNGIAVLVAAALVSPSNPAAVQATNDSAAVFALIDLNEWCPGGSVYLDLKTGSYMLYPRLARATCADRLFSVAVEQGALGAPALERVRRAYVEARRAGLRRAPCDVVVSNGGPEAVVITAPGFSDTTPEEEGCWSEAAVALHRELFEIFGKPRSARK